MKHLYQFITEKFKINKNTKINDTYVYLIVWVDINSNTLYKILNTNEEYKKYYQKLNNERSNTIWWNFKVLEDYIDEIKKLCIKQVDNPDIETNHKLKEFKKDNIMQNAPLA